MLFLIDKALDGAASTFTITPLPPLPAGDAAIIATTADAAAKAATAVFPAGGIESTSYLTAASPQLLMPPPQRALPAAKLSELAHAPLSHTLAELDARLGLGHITGPPTPPLSFFSTTSAPIEKELDDLYAVLRNSCKPCTPDDAASASSCSSRTAPQAHTAEQTSSSTCVEVHSVSVTVVSPLIARARNTRITKRRKGHRSGKRTVAALLHRKRRKWSAATNVVARPARFAFFKQGEETNSQMESENYAVMWCSAIESLSKLCALESVSCHHNDVAGAAC
eukprot:IDg16871t1